MTNDRRWPEDTHSRSNRSNRSSRGASSRGSQQSQSQHSQRSHDHHEHREHHDHHDPREPRRSHEKSPQTNWPSSSSQQGRHSQHTQDAQPVRYPSGQTQPPRSSNRERGSGSRAERRQERNRHYYWEEESLTQWGEQPNIVDAPTHMLATDDIPTQMLPFNERLRANAATIPGKTSHESWPGEWSPNSTGKPDPKKRTSKWRSKKVIWAIAIALVLLACVLPSTLTAVNAYSLYSRDSKLASQGIAQLEKGLTLLKGLSSGQISPQVTGEVDGGEQEIADFRCSFGRRGSACRPAVAERRFDLIGLFAYLVQDGPHVVPVKADFARLLLELQRAGQRGQGDRHAG